MYVGGNGEEKSKVGEKRIGEGRKEGSLVACKASLFLVREDCGEGVAMTAEERTAQYIILRDEVERCLTRVVAWEAMIVARPSCEQNPSYISAVERLKEAMFQKECGTHRLPLQRTAT